MKDLPTWCCSEKNKEDLPIWPKNVMASFLSSSAVLRLEDGKMQEHRYVVDL